MKRPNEHCTIINAIIRTVADSRVLVHWKESYDRLQPRGFLQYSLRPSSTTMQREIDVVIQTPNYFFRSFHQSRFQRDAQALRIERG